MGICLGLERSRRRERNTSTSVINLSVDNVSSRPLTIIPDNVGKRYLRGDFVRHPYGGLPTRLTNSNSGLDDPVRYSALVERVIRDIPL
uniref:Px n=1 Tax=Southern bean mosaic virus TaxID=12139 RepID=A0A8G1GLU1_9VIRU|nr:Px [Southern bean mosaic virus]